VFGFLNGLATKVSGYASIPIWSVVDAPWRLISLTSEGTATTFAPNRSYSGPPTSHLAKFVELPFISSAAEFSALRPGVSSVGPGSPANRSRAATCQIRHAPAVAPARPACSPVPVSASQSVRGCQVRALITAHG